MVGYTFKPVWPKSSGFPEDSVYLVKYPGCFDCRGPVMGTVFQTEKAYPQVTRKR